MPQLNLALMDAIIVSLVIFVCINDYFNILEQTTDELSSYNVGVLIG
jgi:hypothetical protein